MTARWRRRRWRRAGRRPGGDLTLSNTAAVAITHSGSTSLSISSGGYVAVQSVQFAGANIGISDTDLMVLTPGTLTGGRQGGVDDAGDERGGDCGDDAGRGRRDEPDEHVDVTGATTLGSTVELLADAATVTHSGTTPLSRRHQRHWRLQSPQFADNIGISGDTDLMVLTSGTLTVDGKVASTTLETSGAATVGGDLTLSNTAAVAITHSGSTSLSISSNGFVAVESVQFTGSQIGINGDTTMIDLGATAGMVTVNGNLKTTGDLELSNAGAKIGINGDEPDGTDVGDVDGGRSTLDDERGGDCGRRPDAVEHCGSGDLAQRDDVSVDIELTGTWRCSRCSLPATTSASTGTRT